MALRYYFRAADGDIDEIVGRIPALSLDVTINAEEASVAIWQETIDDPSGAFVIGGQRLFYIIEDAVTPGDQRIAIGYTNKRTYSRGDVIEEWIPERTIEVEVSDLNTVLSRRVMTGADNNRPAETDVARMQWAVMTNEAVHITDSTYLSADNPIAMDAVDYTGSYLIDILRDCAEASGKNYFVYWLTNGVFGLFYDFAGSAAWDSGIRLTNVPADVDEDGTDEVQTLAKTGTVSGGTFTISFAGQTTATIAFDQTAANIITALNLLSNVDSGDIAATGGPAGTADVVFTFGGQYAGVDVPLMTVDGTLLTGGGSYGITETTAGIPPTFIVADVSLIVNPDQVHSGIYIPYDGGYSYGQNLDTATAFSRRDEIMSGDYVKTKAKADARRARYLASKATEELRLTITFNMRPANVNLVKAGQLVDVKFSHLATELGAGYVKVRTLTKKMEQSQDDTGFAFYKITMEATPATMAAGPASCPSPTASGNYYPLGGTGTTANVSDGVSYYLRGGIAYPETPTPGHQGHWHFPEYGAGGSATVDYAGDCTISQVRVMVSGDGVLEVHTASYMATSRDLVARLMHAASDGIVGDEVQTGDTGDTFTFNVSTHGGVNCVHWVDVVDAGPACGSKWGYSGATWTLDG